jgi:hypothetical protein
MTERISEKSNFSFIERIMLQHATPLKLTIDLTGVVLGFYFLWANQLIPALTCLFGLSILGNVVVWHVDIQKLAKTKLGQWMLGQAHLANLVIRTIGFFILAYGVWLHSFLPMSVGAIIIILGRVLGTRQT